MGELYPRVERLCVHLEDEQHLLFTDDDEKTTELLHDSEVTQLTAFFMLCLEESQMYNENNPMPDDPYKDGGPPVRDLLYRDVSK